MAGKHTSAEPSAKAPRVERKATTPHARSWSAGFFVKLVLMAVVNALGIYVLISAATASQWGIFAAMLALILAADYVYFSKRTLALKYLIPGLAFLLVFQIFVIAYTGYVAFTNYGDRHMLTKEGATDALLLRSVERVPDSPQYPLVVVESGDDLGFAILDNGVIRAGTETQPLEEVDGVVVDNKITEVSGYDIVNLSELGTRQNEVTELRVPLTDDTEDGAIGTQTGGTGFVFQTTMHYDEDLDALVSDKTGKVYVANGDTGFFEADDGETLTTGWRVNVGFDNFSKAFADQRYSQPFVKVLLWTFAFAFLSVATTFLLGMFLALIMNDERMRGRKVYRTFMLLPYAFPAFMTAFLFAGMMNSKYGFINQVLLGGANVPWLTDPWLAKFSVIFVNLWMGFPYMFLICTGALQSISSDLNEAAEIDGASGFQVWRYITMPQLLTQVTPLLIASFAFNFNNFNLIYMLTRGGPRFSDASVPVGDTDILISMVYQISGLSGQAAKNYGLASAMSILIFLIVGAISMYSFRKSKAMEGAQ